MSHGNQYDVPDDVRTLIEQGPWVDGTRRQIRAAVGRWLAEGHTIEDLLDDEAREKRLASMAPHRAWPLRSAAELISSERLLNTPCDAEPLSSADLPSTIATIAARLEAIEAHLAGRSACQVAGSGRGRAQRSNAPPELVRRQMEVCCQILGDEHVSGLLDINLGVVRRVAAGQLVLRPAHGSDAIEDGPIERLERLYCIVQWRRLELEDSVELEAVDRALHARRRARTDELAWGERA